MGKFFGKNILVLPCPALGDLTIYIRLARNFYNNGARVTVCSDLLSTAGDLFDWVQVKPSIREGNIKEVIASYDLVIAYFGAIAHEEMLNHKNSNLAYVSAKKIPESISKAKQSVFVDGIEYKGATRAFCTDSKKPLTMVQWVDEYCFSAFGLVIPAIKPELSMHNKNPRRILIFPVSPHKKKNYWLGGFERIANKLIKNGWDVKFVCAPNEFDELKSKLNDQDLVTFSGVGELLRYIAGSRLVISNDSGGGHFASMCGVETYTITRREKEFVWRPGFFKNTVIVPWFRFKLLGRYVWRPFVPYWKVVREIGRYK